MTALFVLLAPGDHAALRTRFRRSELTDLTVSLAQLLFPIVLLLGLTGLVVGILNSFDTFGPRAISPLFWNLAIIATLVVLTPQFGGDDRIYAYAIGVLIGTVVQLLLPLPWLRRTGFRLVRSFDWRDAARHARAEADVPGHARPRADQLQPLGRQHLRDADQRRGAGGDRQGVPDLHAAPGRVRGRCSRRCCSRRCRALRRARTATGCALTLATGTRQLLLLLVPTAALILVLSDPITQVIYQRGEFDAAQTDLVSEALFFFALSLPFAGINLLLIRAFFSLQRPWVPTWIALVNLGINAGLDALLYEPMGIGGIPLATAVVSLLTSVGLAVVLRPRLGGIDGRRTVDAAARILIAAGAARRWRRSASRKRSTASSRLTSAGS